jgi:hypothetical protein
MAGDRGREGRELRQEAGMNSGDPIETVIRSHAAWDAIPETGMAGPDSFEVHRLPMLYARQRVALIRTLKRHGGTIVHRRFAPVWADRWQEAIEAFMATGSIPNEMRAPPAKADKAKGKA